MAHVGSRLDNIHLLNWEVTTLIKEVETLIKEVDAAGGAVSKMRPRQPPRS